MRFVVALFALAAFAACVAEFPAEPPAVPDMEMQEPEPDGAPQPEPDPEPDAAPDPEPDAAPDAGPQPETCNGEDDDWDDIVDEDFSLNQACVDGDGFCGLTACAADGSEATCEAGPDGVMQGEETCNSIDDDCDGLVDEGFDVAAVCMVGQGACENFGLEVCAEDGSGTVCDAMPGEGEDEFCNELDDDCDGSVDEGDVCE